MFGPRPSNHVEQPPTYLIGGVSKANTPLDFGSDPEVLVTSLFQSYLPFGLGAPPQGSDPWSYFASSQLD